MAALPARAAPDAVVTHHVMQLKGRPLAYDATAGHVPVMLDGGAEAEMFYVAYTAGKAANRPVLFLFNGGPGAASLWLDLASFGPRRVVTDSPRATPVYPVRLVDNAETLLDAADLVFVDAVGTGYSRTHDAKAFYAVDSDLESFADFITGWLSRNHRWGSARYVLGESYGATRAAALAHVLHDHGAGASGVALMSSFLNVSDRHPGIDAGFVGALPSMAATAWYHHRAGQDVPDLAAWVEQARQFAAGPYADALRLGDRLPPEQEATVRAGLAHFTGLSEADLKRTGLRLDVGQFVRLVNGDGQMAGIDDTRVLARDTDDAALGPSFDAADTVVGQLIPVANRHYLEDELNYHADTAYVISVPDLPDRWDWSHQAPGEPERATSPAMEADLSAAMHEDPTMRVLSLNGYYDLVTPFFATENDLAHMLLPPALRGNLTITHYPAGHMLYLDTPSRQAASADLHAFLGAGR